MSETPKKLISHTPVDEIAAAVVRETTQPFITILMGDEAGDLDGATIEPYGIERDRDSLGKFVVKAGIAGEPNHDVVVHIDEFADDGSLGSVQFVPKDTASTS